MSDGPQPSGTGETGEEVHAQRGRGQQDQLNSIVSSKTRHDEHEVLSRHDLTVATRVSRVSARDIPTASPRPTSRISELRNEETRLMRVRLN